MGGYPSQAEVKEQQKIKLRLSSYQLVPLVVRDVTHKRSLTVSPFSGNYSMMALKMLLATSLLSGTFEIT